MKSRTIYKHLVDVLMTLALLFLMGHHFWGDSAHEWVGAGTFLLFIVHHILNINWWKALFKGRYTPVRILMLAVDVLVMCAMVGLVVSGVILSREVFIFLPIKGGMAFARILHMVSAYWGFLLIAAHLGLHWGSLMRIGRRIGKTQPPDKPRSVIPTLLGGIIALYGMIALFKRDLPSYLFLQAEFVFLDFGESKLLFYLDYLAMMGTFIFLTYFAVKLLGKGNGNK